MSKHPSNHVSAAEDQAALWAAKLDGSSLSSGDRAALEAWLEADPSHRALLSSYCQLSADLEQQVPLLEGIKDLPVEESRAHVTARPSPWLSRPLWGGAMLTAAAAVALAFWLGQPRVDTQTFTAPAAQRQAVALADGTQVEINARTQLNILISANERRAQLNNGEAFFAVARDTKRPFVVETPAGSVQVLGTKFNVRTASDGTLDVAVVEGLVKVRPANAAADDQPITLPAGTRYHRGMVATISRAETDTLLAWRQGQVVFYDVSLDEALAHVARYHDRKIVVSAAAAAERPGGRFGIDNLEEFLANLEAAIGVEAVHQSDGTILVRKAGER